jgi:HEAT repeat protein
VAPVPGTQVAEFIRALALAWKNLAAYPPGHPALAGSVEGAHRTLAGLQGASGEVVLGIAADGIIFGGEKVETSQALKFAQALYARQVAVVRFAAATTAGDLDSFLRLIAGIPGQKPLRIWQELPAAGVTNIQLQPVDYSAVQVTDDLKVDARAPRDSLWDEILHALVAGRELSPKAQQLLSRDIRSVDELSTLVLRYIDTVDEEALAHFDPDATFGVRLHQRRGKSAEAITARVAEAVGAHVASSTGLRRQLAVQQIVQLLRTMPEPLRGAVMRSVLQSLATDESAAPALREIAATLDNDEVVEALRYLSTVANLSPQAMTLLQSLVELQHKHEPPQPAQANVIGELVELFGDEDIDRFNPPDHKSLLKDVAIQMPGIQLGDESQMETLGPSVETVAPEEVERQLAATILELLAKYGSTRDATRVLARAETLFRSEIAAAHLADALELVGRLHHIAGATSSTAFRDAINGSLQRLGNTETVQSLVDGLGAAPPEKAAIIYRIIDSLGTVATRNLLLALSEEDNRSRRRRLFDLVTSLGPPIVAEVIRFLDDERWYVVRNMILLLRSVNDRTSLPDIRRLAQHGDLRVRLEAIKTLLAFDASVPRTLLEEAINDRDPKLAETAITLVGNYGIKEGVDPLLQILSSRDVFGSRRPLRLRAIKALGELAEPAALSRMEHLFSTSILPWPNRAERYAAFESLAAYPPEARARFVARGLRARDRQIREICRRLSGS